MLVGKSSIFNQDLTQAVISSSIISIITRVIHIIIVITKYIFQAKNIQISYVFPPFCKHVFSFIFG